LISPSLLLLALATTFDSFLAGVSYGYAKIRVPFYSLAIAGLMTGATVMLSMSFGGLLGRMFGPDFARWLGASLLVVTGALALRNGHSAGPGDGRGAGEGTGHSAGDGTGHSAGEGTGGGTDESELMPSVTLRFLGVLVQIIREPRAADVDESRTIDAREAIALGAALSVDSAGVGLGAALAGFDALWMTVLASATCPLSLALGTWLGMHALPTGSSAVRNLPAWVLIVVGLLRLL